MSARSVLSASRFGLSSFTAADKLAAIKRELVYRRRVYPRRIAAATMTQALADRQIAIFEAIAADYEELAAGERLL